LVHTIVFVNIFQTVVFIKSTRYIRKNKLLKQVSQTHTSMETPFESNRGRTKLFDLSFKFAKFLSKCRLSSPESH